MCPFKGNLPAENAPVQSVASGERKEKYDCYRPNDLLLHKFNPVYAQMCPFKGNLPAENASVQSVASGEGGKMMSFHQTKFNPVYACTNVSIQGQLTC